MELIPLLFITLDTLIKYAPWIGAIGTFLVGAYKDQIMQKLNLKKGTREADSIHIQNSEQLMGLYRKSVDDLNKLNEEHIAKMRENHKEEIDDIKAEHQRNLGEIKDEHAKTVKAKDEENEKEKTSLKDTVEKLEKQVTRLTKMVDKLGKQIAFYREHSDLELPDDLQD